jgi:hypothetical protein
MSSEIVDGLRTLGVRELGKAMGLPTWRIYELIGLDAAPPFLRIGKTYRFRVRDVDARRASRVQLPSRKLFQTLLTLSLSKPLQASRLVCFTTVGAAVIDAMPITRGSA